MKLLIGFASLLVGAGALGLAWLIPGPEIAADAQMTYQPLETSEVAVAAPAFVTLAPEPESDPEPVQEPTPEPEPGNNPVITGTEAPEPVLVFEEPGGAWLSAEEMADLKEFAQDPIANYRPGDMLLTLGFCEELVDGLVLMRDQAEDRRAGSQQVIDVYRRAEDSLKPNERAAMREIEQAVECFTDARNGYQDEIDRLLEKKAQILEAKAELERLIQP